MPLRAPRVCGCGAVHQSGERCPKAMERHRERKAAHDRKRPSSSARGYDAEWEREAKAFLALPENSHCQCGRPAKLVAHRRSIKSAPHLRLVKANWRASCFACNARDTARERREQRIEHHG